MPTTTAFDASTDLAYSQVASPPTPSTSGLTLTVLPGQGAYFGTRAPFWVLVWPQAQSPTPANATLLRTTGIAGDTLTLDRAQDKLARRTMLVGDQIMAPLTAESLQAIQAAVNALETKSGITGSTSDDTFALSAGTGLKLPFGLVHASVHGVTGDGSPADETRIRAAIATGDHLFFPAPQTDYVISTGSLPITTPGQWIFSPRGRWRVTGRPFPLFDVQTGADGVRIWADHLLYDQGIAPAWLRADDVNSTIRGERRNSFCNGVYTCAAYGDFRANLVEGFYVGMFATNWNTGTGSFDGSTLRLGNRFEFGFKNVFTGLGYCGQQGLRHPYISGSYRAQGVAGQMDYNPPHAFYCTTDSPSKDCGGEGYCYDSTGLGHCFDVTRVGAVTGGTVAITVTLASGVAATATVPATANAATVAPLIAALSNVGANNVSVYDLPDVLDAGIGWRFVFDHSIGSLAITTGVSVDSTNVLGGGGYASAEFQPFNSGAPWRLKTLNGGTFGRLVSNNTPGSMEIVTNATQITVQTVRSTNSNPTSGGALTIDPTTSHCTIERWEEDLTADGRALSLHGTDNRILSAAVSAVSPARNVADPYIVVRGTRNKLHVERLVNTGAGGRFGIQQWSGDQCEISVGRMDGMLEQAVMVLAGVTNSVVDVDSRRIYSWSPAALSPFRPWVDSSGVIGNRFNRYDVRRRGLGTMLPQEQGWAAISQAPTPNRAYFLRCYLDQWMLIKTLWVDFTGTLAGNEKFDFGIYDETGAALWRLGQTQIPAGTSNRSISVDPAAQYYPGNTILYVGYVQDTAIAAYMANWATGVNMTNQFATVVPYVENLALDGQTTGLPASMSGASSGQGAVPILGVRST